MPFALTRRAVIAALSAIVGTHILGPRTASALSGMGAESARTEALLALLPHRHSADEIGRAYLSAAPDEADPARLLRLLHADAAGMIGFDPDVLRAQIRQRLRLDFTAGRTVVVEGWILSQTEARLCALSALSAQTRFWG